MIRVLGDKQLNPIQPFRPDGPIVVPAKTAYLTVYRSRPDTDAEQRSENNATLQSGSPAFAIPRRIPFGPFIEKRFAQPQQFTEKDWTTLEGLLGPNIPEDLRWHIDEACELYVNSVALQNQMAKWKDLRDLLEEIVPAAKTLLKFLSDPQRSEPIIGALTAVQTVRSFIHDELSDPLLDLLDLSQGLTAPPQGLNRLLPDLERLIAFGEPALLSARKGAGNEEQAELRLFLKTLADVAAALGVPTRLPGSYELANAGPKGVKPTKRITFAFFRFAKEVLRLAKDYGKLAISETSLSPEEKAAARETLVCYAEKSDKTLSRQFNRIIKKPRVARKPKA